MNTEKIVQYHLSGRPSDVTPYREWADGMLRRGHLSFSLVKLLNDSGFLMFQVRSTFERALAELKIIPPELEGRVLFFGLKSACEQGDIAEVQEWLAKGITPLTRLDGLCNALEWTVLYRQNGVLKFFSETGVLRQADAALLRKLVEQSLDMRNELAALILLEAGAPVDYRDWIKSAAMGFDSVLQALRLRGMNCGIPHYDIDAVLSVKTPRQVITWLRSFLTGGGSELWPEEKLILDLTDLSESCCNGIGIPCDSGRHGFLLSFLPQVRSVNLPVTLSVLSDLEKLLHRYGVALDHRDGLSAESSLKEPAQTEFCKELACIDKRSFGPVSAEIDRFLLDYLIAVTPKLRLRRRGA